MRTESCREWRESLGAYTLGHLSAPERSELEAHLRGCAGCRAEAASLTLVSRLLPYADPEHFTAAPVPPPGLGERVAARIDSERRHLKRRQRRRYGLALGAASAAFVAAALAIFVVSGGGGPEPQRHVSFGALPAGMKIAATLESRPFGTEIRMYVNGVPSGTLCRVFLRGQDGIRVSAGTFRYRWGGDSEAVLSSALALSKTVAIGVRAGGRTFIAPLGTPTAAITPIPRHRDSL